MTRANNTSAPTFRRRYPALDTAAKDPKQMINVITTDSRAAEIFFFDRMYGKMAALVNSYSKSYAIDVTTADLSCVTYLACWENNWEKLRAFNGGTTIYNWVAKIAGQATYRFLIEERYIDGINVNDASNYRLTLLSIADKNVRQEIVDLVFVPELHMVLEKYYVRKESRKEIASFIGSEEEADSLLKKADKMLVTRLLNTYNDYADIALSYKKAIDPEVQWEEWYDRIDEGDVSENQQALRDILARLTGNEDWDDNVRSFVLAIIDELDWNDYNRYLWNERFFLRTPSSELAQRENVRPSCIDNRFSHLMKVFRIAVRSWWNRHGA